MLHSQTVMNFNYAKRTVAWVNLGLLRIRKVTQLSLGYCLKLTGVGQSMFVQFGVMPVQIHVLLSGNYEDSSLVNLYLLIGPTARHPMTSKSACKSSTASQIFSFGSPTTTCVLTFASCRQRKHNPESFSSKNTINDNHLGQITFKNRIAYSDSHKQTNRTSAADTITWNGTG